MYLASSLKHSSIHDRDFKETNSRSSMKRDALETINPSAFTKRDNHNFTEENHDLISAAEIIKGNITVGFIFSSKKIAVKCSNLEIFLVVLTF